MFGNTIKHRCPIKICDRECRILATELADFNSMLKIVNCLIELSGRRMGAAPIVERNVERWLVCNRHILVGDSPSDITDK